MKPVNPNPFRQWSMLLVFMLAGVCLQGQQQVSDPIDYVQGMLIGKGYNYYLGEISPKSPLVSSAYKTQPYDGQFAIPTAKVITNYEELENELEVNANASINALVASASIKASIYNKVHFEKNTFYLLLKTEILNSYDYLSEDPVLNAEALKVLKSPSALSNFTKIYGNTFVFGLGSGGAYYGLIRVESTNQQNLLEAESAIKAQSILSNAEINMKLKEFAQSKKVSFTCEERITGGIGLGAPSQNLDDMVGKVRILANQVRQHPVAIKAQVCPYAVFLEYLDVSSAFGVDRELALLALNYNYLDYLNLKKSLSNVVETPVFYRFKPNDQTPKVKELQNRIRDIDANLIKIFAERAAIADVSKPLTPSKVEAPQSFASKIMLPNLYEAPVRQLSTVFTPVQNEIYPLTRHTMGDTEMDGHQPNITLTVDIVLKPGNLPTSASMIYNCKMKEAKSDWTTFEDTITRLFLKKDFDFPSGLILKKIDPMKGAIHAQAGNDDHEFTLYKSGSGLIKSAGCRSDTPGNEVNELGCKNIVFAPVTVTYQHLEDAKNLQVVYTPASDAPVKVLIHKAPKPENLIRMKMDIKTLKLNLNTPQN